MQDPTDLPGLIETVNYAASQNDRWLLIATLVLFIVAGGWMTRYFTAQIQIGRVESQEVTKQFTAQVKDARAESQTVMERFTEHLIKTNADLSLLMAHNTKALERNTHALEKVERKLG